MSFQRHGRILSKVIHHVPRIAFPPEITKRLLLSKRQGSGVDLKTLISVKRFSAKHQRYPDAIKLLSSVKRKSKIPVTLKKNPEPKRNSDDWIVWAAWADRVTFEEIFERTGLNENEVKRHMRKSLKRKSYINWRSRVNSRKTKHRKLFKRSRDPYFGDPL